MTSLKSGSRGFRAVVKYLDKQSDYGKRCDTCRKKHACVRVFDNMTEEKITLKAANGYMAVFRKFCVKGGDV